MFSFVMKFLGQQFLCVDDICSKLQGQKVSSKKDIHSLPTCVVLRNNHRNYFTIANFDTLQWLKNCIFTLIFLSQNDFYVNNMCDKIHIKKDIQNLPTCVIMRNHFTIASFDTLLRAKCFFIYHEFFITRTSLC